MGGAAGHPRLRGSHPNKTLPHWDQRMLRIYLLVQALIVGTTCIADPIIDEMGVEFSFEDAFAYSLRVTNPDAYVESVSRPGATTRVIENLYVLKRAEQEAISRSLISTEEQDYLFADVFRRAALDRFVTSAVDTRMADIDWNGLAAEEYAERKSQLMSEEQVRAQHLLVSTENRTFDEFVDRVRLVEDGLKQGAEFASLVKQYSDDPSAHKNDGDLGFFTMQRMQPPFAAAAFSLSEPGELAGPIMTIFGAHFIRFLDRKAATQLSFEEVRESLIAEIKRSTRLALREEVLGEFRAEIQATLSEIDEVALRARFIQAYGARTQ